jgi:hypothetical protein
VVPKIITIFVTNDDSKFNMGQICLLYSLLLLTLIFRIPSFIQKLPSIFHLNFLAKPQVGLQSPNGEAKVVEPQNGEKTCF